MRNRRAVADAAVLTLGVLAFTLVASFTGRARAQEQEHHHPLHEMFYSQWKQPGTDLSCCNARVTINGVEMGDCEPTQAEMRAGAWWAWLRQENRWIEIPDDRVIRERNPSGQDAHLCWSYGRVLCFVPPDTGG